MSKALANLLSDEMIEELAQANDESQALRLAVLHCIMLLENRSEPAVRKFVDFLLVGFAPIAGRFHKHTHVYASGLDVLRYRTDNGHVGLVLPIERIVRVLARDWN